MTRIGHSLLYISSWLARSREQDDFTIYSFASRLQAYFVAFCTSAALSARHHLCSNLPSAPFEGRSLVLSQLLAELQRP